MKKQSENTMNLLGQKIEKTLNQAVCFNKPRVFSSVDMWNIQRRGTTMLQRRYSA